MTIAKNLLNSLNDDRHKMSQFPQAFTRIDRQTRDKTTDARQTRDRRETDARRRETRDKTTDARQIDADRCKTDARQMHAEARQDARQDARQTQTHAFGTLDVNRRRQTRDARETNARRRETHARQMHADARQTQTQTDARRETHADAQTEPDAAYSIY